MAAYLPHVVAAGLQKMLAGVTAQSVPLGGRLTLSFFLASLSVHLLDDSD